MTDHLYAEDAAALRAELASVRARQEVLADALAAAGEEMEKLQGLRAECDRLRAVAVAARAFMVAAGEWMPGEKLTGPIYAELEAALASVSPEGEA